MAFSTCSNDSTFGPVVKGCRGDFDFTLKFELIFFSLIPSSIFVTLSICRSCQLFKRPKVIDARTLLILKLIFLVAYSIVQLARLLSLATASRYAQDGLSLSASALVFITSLPVIMLSYLEHGRSIRPSTLLSIYMSLTLLFDIVHTRTLWLANIARRTDINAGIFTASVALKIVVLFLESKKKTKWLHRDAKEHSPEETCGVFDLGFYTWLYRLFSKGFTSVLEMCHLYHLDERMSSEKLHDKLTSSVEKGGPPGGRYRLAKALLKALIWPFLLPAIPRLALIGFTFSQPFFISSVLNTITLTNEDKTRNDRLGLIGASFLIYTGLALSRAFYGYLAQRLACMARGCLASAIFDKTTESQILAGDDAAAVTLMSTDIERIMRALESFHEVWANALEAGLGCWLLQRKLGFAFLSPVIVIILSAAAMVWVGRTAKKSQALWMAKIQTRVGATSKIIAHIKPVKLSGIAGPVEKLIQTLRIEELALGNKFRGAQAAAAAIAFSPQALSPVLAFAFAGCDLNVSTMYESLSYMILLSSPLASLFQEIPSILAAFTCLQRIQTFLDTEPRRDFRTRLDTNQRVQPSSSERTTISNIPSTRTIELGSMSSPKSTMATSDTVLSIANGSFGWKVDQMVLRSIYITIRAAQITFITGPVACGKSTFCKAILGDIPFANGEIRLHPSVSSIAYCDQVPFLTRGTLKQNIVGHHHFDQKRYDDVIWAVALVDDVATLPHGHDTDIGSSGATLSGGQKARLSLARALYHGSLFLVLDDIFSGLDNKTEADVFHRVFGPHGLLRNRGATAILCTHSKRHFALADRVVTLGPGGAIIKQETYQKPDHKRQDADFIDPKAMENAVEVNDQTCETQVSRVHQSGVNNTVTEALDERSRQLGDFKVYKHYFSNMKKLLIVAMIISCIIAAAGLHLPPVWVGFWAADSLGKSNNFYLGIFGLFSSFMVIGITAGAFITACLMSKDVGKQLHRNALSTVMNAPLGFFTATDTGTITNLFSQDMTIIDGELSMYLLNFVFGITGILGSGFVIALASPYLAISYPVLIIIGWTLQLFYLRTSRQLRLLDLEAKSPLYTHFLDVIKGLATIRALGWVQSEIAHNRHLLDTSQRPAYLLAMIQQCLIMALSLMVAMMSTMLTVLATQLRTSTGFTGASLVAVMQFGQLAANLMYSYTALETSIGAVSRLKKFSDMVPLEDQVSEKVIPSVDWPHNGAIELRNISASHKIQPNHSTEKTIYALNNIALNIQAGEKVAICGRTGSGKSSLILFLFRLLDPLPSSNGTFTIDNTNVFTIKRSTLRTRIIAIPQECVFLPNGYSIKSNIDPTGSISDAECLSILSMVQLSDFVSSKGGLHAPMSGDQLSGGQQQLFSLGRAIYRRRARVQASGIDGGLLLLDEISSAVDHETEKLMQEIISKEFDTYTVIAVAHRLQMMVEFADKIVVMEGGSVAETGAPRDLLARPDSKFQRLYTLGLEVL